MDKLNLYVVYDHPLDNPGAFVVRRWELESAKEIVAVGITLDSVRERLNAAVPGLCNIGRHPEDDQKIVEVWV